MKGWDGEEKGWEEQRAFGETKLLCASPEAEKNQGAWGGWPCPILF